MGGDANSAADYMLVCSCEVDLGPLARFLPNAEGFRTAWCRRCDHVTIVRGTQVLKVMTLAELEAKRVKV
jgi:hypothetical protein